MGTVQWPSDLAWVRIMVDVSFWLVVGAALLMSLVNRYSEICLRPDRRAAQRRQYQHVIGMMGYWAVLATVLSYGLSVKDGRWLSLFQVALTILIIGRLGRIELHEQENLGEVRRRRTGG